MKAIKQKEITKKVTASDVPSGVSVDHAHYDHRKVEDAWQKKWEEAALDVADIEGSKHFYNLMMFPYPSAEGLHVGNMYAFTGSDIYGRYKRMQGYEVFEPIGLDGFGIHSENYAFKIGKHPMDQAAISEERFYHQLHRIGAMFDWTRTVETYHPDYYKWTQWLFVAMFQAGLAYRSKAQVNWCPSCKTVLADEQVIEEKCERCGYNVTNKLLEQWFFRITAYAGKLLENIPSLDWSEKVKTAQRNWIGESQGVTFMYKVKDKDIHFQMFDSVPQTFMAQTFTVIAPEHPKLLDLVIGTEYEKPVMEFVERIKKQKAAKKGDTEKEIEGIFTGRYIEYAPANRLLPIWVASFVIADYGTGVVNASAHDERDFAFAKKYHIPLHPVMFPENPKEAQKVKKLEYCYHHALDGILTEPHEFYGRRWGDVRADIITFIERNGWGDKTKQYHLRDWLISRQRYWGSPIPMMYCASCKEKARGERSDMPGWWSVPVADLPVLLPRIDDYKPGDDGVAPLAKHKEFYEATCPGCGGKAVRETDVSDTFLDSSWYFLRYPSIRPAEVASKNFDPSSVSLPSASSGQARKKLVYPESIEGQSEAGQNFSGSPQGSDLPWDPAITKHWLPVSMYTGGAEHSVLHLLYSRFVTMALHDMGYIDFDEPFAKFFAHGLVIKEGTKMSKSKGNIINPDVYIDKYGIDSLRLYLMFMGPYSQGGDFRDAAMEGMSRWVGRVWRMSLKSLSQHSSSSSATIHSALQKAIKKVGEDTEHRHYNTAIAAMMEFTNLVLKRSDTSEGLTPIGIDDLIIFIKLLAPYAPFLAEELWSRTKNSVSFSKKSSTNSIGANVADNVVANFPIRPAGGSPSQEFRFRQDSVHCQFWPVFDPQVFTEKTVTVVVQINGKLRDSFVLPQEVSQIQDEVEKVALMREKIILYLAGKKVQKVVFVPGRLINVVVL